MGGGGRMARVYYVILECSDLPKVILRKSVLFCNFANNGKLNLDQRIMRAYQVCGFCVICDFYQHAEAD